LKGSLRCRKNRLKLDSKNSSKLPSSDGPASGNRAQRRASARKRCAQVGHKGSFRALVDGSQVDQIIDCAPPAVCECGVAVIALDDDPSRHQVFDVPPVKAQVHVYRRHAGLCAGGGKAHRAPLPAGVPSGQIRPRALALVGVLGTHFHLTQYKIRDLMARLLGIRPTQHILDFRLCRPDFDRLCFRWSGGWIGSDWV
jgi:transposase